MYLTLKEFLLKRILLPWFIERVKYFPSVLVHIIAAQFIDIVTRVTFPHKLLFGVCTTVLTIKPGYIMPTYLPPLRLCCLLFYGEHPQSSRLYCFHAISLTAFEVITL